MLRGSGKVDRRASTLVVQILIVPLAQDDEAKADRSDKKRGA
jgi:hypothetical protein